MSALTFCRPSRIPAAPLAILIGVALGALLILASGRNPLTAYWAIIRRRARAREPARYAELGRAARRHDAGRRAAASRRPHQSGRGWTAGDRRPRRGADAALSSGAGADRGGRGDHRSDVGVGSLRLPRRLGRDAPRCADADFEPAAFLSRRRAHLLHRRIPSARRDDGPGADRDDSPSRPTGDDLWSAEHRAHADGGGGCDGRLL